jgi:hypothetical protein
MRVRSIRAALRRRRSSCWGSGVKQAGPANLRPARPAPWGPHCYLHQNRHDEPFNKRDAGHKRRATKLHKLRERETMLASTERDDGYFSMEGWYE